MRAVLVALLVGLTGLFGVSRAAFAAEPAPVAAPTEDKGWPRQLVREGATLVYYQPELDEWKDYKVLKCRIAFSLTPKGGKETLGVASIGANTLVDTTARTVFLRDIAVTSVRFPSADAATAQSLEALLKTMMPSGGEPIALDRVMAMVERDKVPARAVAVKNDPPRIFYSEKPALLLIVDGDPAFAPVEGTDLEFVVNTNWDLFREKSSKNYFLLATKGWLTSKDPAGPWTATQSLPKDMARLPAGQNFDDVRKMVPAPATKAVPEVFYNKGPAELIEVKGKPAYTKIPGTSLRFVTNTEEDLFVDEASKQFYLLLSGRWFRSPLLGAAWAYAGADLPPDFAKIPPTSTKARVRASVPGTQEAADAVMLAQIPTTAVIDKAAAASGVKVAYDGPPKFMPIPGTSIQYAVNTEQRVLKVNNVYYLCFQGVWFMSLAATGPWQTADSVPPEIYTIPPSSPVYNVTYVTQTNATPTTVECSHTSGYFGSFVIGVGVGVAIGYGTGWYYPPYYYYPPGYGYPIYRPWPPTYGVGAVYNPATGGYAMGRAAYGPYGAVGGAAWYNPSTGRYGRAASVQTPYGGRTVATSYNPWTGGYARTSQGHNAYSQWGSTVATRGNQWVQTGHVTTAGGTTAAFRTSSGNSGVVKRNANGTVARTDNGFYAGKDGNVYKRNGRGDWSQYENGNWNQVDRAQPKTQDLDRAAQARQRGQTEANRNRPTTTPRSTGSSGGSRGGSGGSRGGGGMRGGGRR
jgi:hypothetical protein